MHEARGKARRLNNRRAQPTPFRPLHGACLHAPHHLPLPHRLCAPADTLVDSLTVYEVGGACV